MNGRVILSILISLLLTIACNKKHNIKHSRPEAEQLLKHGIKVYEHPNNKKLVYDYLDMLLNERHYAQALYFLETQVSKNFEKDDQFYDYLFKASRGGKYFEKIRQINNHLHPDIAKTLLPVIDSITYFNKKIKYNPRDKNAYYQRAQLFYKIHEWEAAEYDFKQAGTDEMYAFDTFYNLIMIKFVNQKYKDALREVNRYSSDNLNPEEQQILTNIKKVLTDIVQIEDNASLTDSQKHFEKAKLLVAMKDYDLAVNEVTKAISMDGTFGDAYALRAYILFQQRKFKTALSDIETAENITGKRGSGLSKMIKDSLEVYQ